MRRSALTKAQVLGGYDAVRGLYPHTPSLSLWRAWEYAAYQQHRLAGPMLDVGCGDGRFCHLVWPELDDIVGIDHDLATVERARRSGTYRSTHVAQAQDLPFDAGKFGSVFANCSLEHVDDLPTVLDEICRCLKPGGSLLFSVVTEHFVEWPGLAHLLAVSGASERAREVDRNWRAYHHLQNPFSEQAWIDELTKAELEVVSCQPIVPRLESSVFLLMDQLWHLPKDGREMGDELHALFAGLPSFPSSFRQILSALLDLEPDLATGSGIVLLARKA